MRRRSILFAPLLLSGCSLLPQKPLDAVADKLLWDASEIADRQLRLEAILVMASEVIFWHTTAIRQQGAALDLLVVSDIIYSEKAANWPHLSFIHARQALIAAGLNIPDETIRKRLLNPTAPLALIFSVLDKHDVLVGMKNDILGHLADKSPEEARAIWKERFFENLALMGVQP